MKKSHLSSLAALGLASSLVANDTHATFAYRYGEYQNQTSYSKAKDQCNPPAPKSERKLFSEINAESRRLYNSLDCEGKNLAIRLAEQKCAGQNECAGLNACKSDKNSCAGQGSCKGQGKSSFADKNIAVQVAAKHMAKKRSNMYQEEQDKLQQSPDNYNNRYGY